MTQGGEGKKGLVQLRLAASAASIAFLLTSMPALAQAGRVEVPNQSPASATINLVLQLVKQGAMSPQNGAILIQQALGSSVDAETVARAQQQINPTQVAAVTKPSSRGRPMLEPVVSTIAPEQLAVARAMTADAANQRTLPAQAYAEPQRAVPLAATAPRAELADLVPPPPPAGSEALVAQAGLAPPPMPSQPATRPVWAPATYANMTPLPPRSQQGPAAFAQAAPPAPVAVAVAETAPVASPVAARAQAPTSYARKAAATAMPAHSQMEALAASVQAVAAPIAPEPAPLPTPAPVPVAYIPNNPPARAALAPTVSTPMTPPASPQPQKPVVTPAAFVPEAAAAPVAQTAPAPTKSAGWSVRPPVMGPPAPLDTRRFAQADAPAPTASAPVAPMPPAPQPVPVQASAPPAPVSAATPAAAAAPAPTIRVSYVPESVRKQIADEVRQEVMAQAKSEGWAAPGDASPDWVRRITVSGDFRFRSQSNLYSKANQGDVGDAIFDYTAVNATPGGADFTNPQNLAYQNVTQDRWNRLRYRARLGVTANISPQVEVGFRLASGDDRTPVSTNQILGGGLAKNDVWLDHAYLTLRPTTWSTANFGRFANPFWSTDLLFDEDLNFDGVSGEVRSSELLSGVKLALRGGAFPLDFGSGNYPDTSTTKYKAPTKWLFSGQIEADFQPRDDLLIRLGGAYHYFTNVQGKQSTECQVNGVIVKYPAGNGTDATDPIECSSDWSRAFFPRYGNTLFFIRNLQAPDLLGVAQDRQYLGLTYKFHILDLNAQVATRINDKGLNATLSGNYVQNLGFKKSDECRYGPTLSPLTNTSGLGHVCDGTDVVQSGNKGWLVNLAVGYDKPRKWGQWRLEGGYRYLQTDAVLDSLTDSDFHLGGTNTKGYTVKGSMGLYDGLRLGARWLSANEITGRPLAIDVLQIDLEAEF